MARPIKKGLDYFPVDTDIFENIQIRKLKNQYKSSGFLVYFAILCDIYKKEGYFLRISEDYLYDLSDRMGETEEEVQKIIDYCLQINLFDRQKYDLFHILTSKSIQERYILVVKRCKNPICEEFSCVNVPETGVSVTEMRQRKEKESKGNLQQQQQRMREEPKEEPQNLDEEREQWKDALLADEDWLATIVRYAGKGTAVLQHTREAMAVFDDYLRLKFSLDTIRTKKDYSQSFVGWWRYHNFNLKMEELSGGTPKTILQPIYSSNQPERRSKIEELMETGKRATEIAMKIYNSQAV
ncbi:DUF4373 domain-containing protein [Parabacteroides gordonii]|uniref:DUF4373 domain-containing protein n=1 Tax=Parabacteroides gordonii TaxID=574930 RepID=UPI0026ECD1F3|nr:DUF4373 domain-containing protein [Parabacteroides gordonii]